MENKNTNGIEQEIIETLRQLPEQERCYLKGVADALLSKHQIEQKSA